jgi:prevent-host-death family protein
MMTVDMSEGPMRLEDLLKRVEQGEDVVLTREGRPVARLSPHAPVSGESVADAVAALGTHWQSHNLGSHRWAAD